VRHEVAQDPFYAAFRGPFTGVLSWEQLDQFWNAVRRRASAGWYVYAVGEPLPEQPRSENQINDFVTEIDALLRREHDEDYCGIVYADNVIEPSFIKIFDPHNLGVQCGFSDNPPLPGWVMSQIPPSLLETNTLLTGSRRRWWQRLWG
jgi:hypothetical protein